MQKFKHDKGRPFPFSTTNRFIDNQMRNVQSSPPRLEELRCRSNRTELPPIEEIR